MSATRTTLSRRPAGSRAGRLVSHALLAIVWLIVAVFAHGGACAALELSEQASHSAQLGDGGHVADQGHVAAAQHRAHCWHHQLPERHRHSTEQDGSATHPAGPPTGAPMPAAIVVSPPAAVGGTAPAAVAGRPTSCQEDLCVMRI
ncbi:hypothetical protein [Nonomuraea ferruginea]|uniref:Uncharacterized protein n=1 Tax=Nonomuraea ferruginea TaxID=46174 RepID=A0ABT4SQW4_9ACTN|nr:hypothetical protein [Nonomuraea ferruginea]MDA0639653.1 hypothetical protein [Nonomuraea ferruginea]